MNTKRREWLKKHYRYEDWAGGEGGHGFHGIHLRDGLLEGWKLEYIDRELGLGLSLKEHAFFTPRESERREVLVIDLWECREAAVTNETIVDVLFGFESLSLERVTGDEVVGDITFAFKQWTMLFAHSNLILLIRNGGKDLVDVTGPARELDMKLTSEVEF